MIECVVIDSQENIERIQQLKSNYSFLNIVKYFTYSIEAARYIRRNNIDVIFMNTHLPTISGFEFYATFPKIIKVVYFSSFKELAYKAYDLDAIDYLLFPYTDLRYNQMMDKVQFYFSNKRSVKVNTQSFTIQVRSDYSTINIDLREIVFIETLDDYVKIHLHGKKPILTLMSLKSMLDKLPELDFVRVHRSYIVSLKYIESVRGKRINIGMTDLPIGKSHEKIFFERYVKETF